MSRGGAGAAAGAGFGCLVAFAAPFMLAGSFAGYSAVRAGMEGDAEQALLGGIVALVFGGVGVGLVALARYGRAAARDRAEREARHPDEPWRWREDWASGRITDDSRASLVGAWVFAAFWNLVSLPASVPALRDGVAQRQPAALLVLLFPAVGLGLLWWAVRRTLHWRRFGVSVLELDRVPVPLGRALSGTVRVPGELPASATFRAVLSRIQRVTTGSGRNRSTRESVEWQEEATIAGRRDARGVAVPVTFRIPADQPPADVDAARNGTVWRLELSADVPGVDYHAAFELPVFRTAESDAPPEPDEVLPPAPDLTGYRQPASSRIRVSSSRRGTEIVFGRARNPGMAIGVTIWAAMFCVATAVLVRLDAPTVFPIVFGGFALLLVLVAAHLWLGVSHVAVGDGAVAVRRGLLGAGTPTRVPAREIADVVVTIGMRAGNTPYYDVKLLRRGGRPVTLGTGVRDKREAEWLADLVRRGAGVG